MRRFSALALLLAAACAALFAQADRGVVAGTVTDTTGAVVPSAVLTLRNEATNLIYAASPGAEGSYTFLNLPVGTYTLTVEAKGFQRQEIRGIQVQVNQQSRVDVSLRVGEVTETVQVQAAAPMIQTESTDVGTVIDNKRFLDLPLTLGGGIRNPSTFILSFFHPACLQEAHGRNTSAGADRLTTRSISMAFRFRAATWLMTPK